MIYPEIRLIHSPDLEPPQLPADPYDCEVYFQVVIGPAGAPGEERFGFTVVTPARLAHTLEASWGRGRLIIAAFDWQGVIQAVAKLLASAARPTWDEVAAELGRSLLWEFDQSADADA
jgi:hypothetical protein